MYNLTQIGTNTTGIVSLAQTTSDVLLLGWGGTLLLIGIMVTLFMTFNTVTQDANKSFLITMFIGFILGLLFFAIGLIKNYLVLLIIAVAWAFLMWLPQN